MRAYAVSGTGTELGKTYVACALIEALRKAGRSVDAFKPVLSDYSDETLAASDAGRLLAALGRPMSAVDQMSPLRFKAALAPSSAARLEGQTLLLAPIAALCRDWLADTTAETALIEGAGGVMSPLAEDGLNLDLFEALSLPVILVGGSYLGAATHALTAIAAVRQRGLPIAAFVVSESEGANPPLGEILGSLERFAPDIAVFVAPRGAAFDAGELAARL